MSHILFLSYDGLTDNLGQSQIIPYLNAFQRSGHVVHVISADKPALFKKRKEAVDEQLESGIDWISIPYTKSPLILSTFFDLRRMKREALRLIKENEIQVVHVRSYPPMDLALGLKRRFGLKVLFDMRGFYPEERMEGGIWKKSNPLHRILFNILKKKELRYLSQSDHIITLTEKAKATLCEKNKIKTECITVIPCCADFDHFQSLEGYRTDKKLRIVYLGSLGTWYLIPEMLAFFKRVKDTFKDAELSIYTGDVPSEVWSQSKLLGLNPDSIQVSSIEREAMPNALSNFDLSLFLIQPSYSKKASSPTKLAEILACGIPVVCNREVGDLKTISNELIGVNAFAMEEFRHLDINSLVSSIIQLDKDQIRSEAYQRFDNHVATQQYLSAYDTILSMN